jgi:hypothetical protein
MKKSFLLLICQIFLSIGVYAQEDDFDFSQFEQADSAKIKIFCNNKVLNLSPTKLVSIGYDYVAPFDMEVSETSSENTIPVTNNAAKISPNHGFRLNANFPVISTNKFILNASLGYWESRYNVKEGNGMPFATKLNDSPLRTTTAGFTIFKPLNQKHFLIFQGEAALNGNYDFSDIKPDFGFMKYSAAALFGWKFDDNTNFAVGVTRTYRGGAVLHIPIVMYNKTFNQKWGIEALLPARGSVRYNFSTKSLLMFGYELEGQSYYMQSTNDNNRSWGYDKLELQKSEIRPRISWDKAITDFIWFNVQAGVRVNYRFELVGEAGDETPLIQHDMGIPFYFNFSLNLVSP